MSKDIICEKTKIGIKNEFTLYRLGNRNRDKTYQVSQLFYICHTTCSYCGDIIPISNKGRTKNNNSHICSKCYKSLIQCRDCGCTRDILDMDGNVCKHCLKNKVIKNFNARANNYLDFIHCHPSGELIFSREPLPCLTYYGVEFEVGINGRSFEREFDAPDQKTVKNIVGKKVISMLGKDFIVCKHDGTIEFGFEIVTAPASIKVHESKWRRFFLNQKDLFLRLKGEDCGMHIHASRSNLSDLQIGKMMNFIYNKDNRNFISYIAGRDSNHYSMFDLDKKITDVFKPNGVKYEALNISNEKTIELRIFKIVDDYDLFMKNLEFYDALIKFSNQSSIKDSGDLDNFLNFVSINRKEFPNLAEYVKNN